MHSLTPFTVLIERRALARLPSAVFLGLTLLAALPALHGAQAQGAGAAKIAGDLARVIAAPIKPELNWVTDVNGQRPARALLVGNGIDPDLTELRTAALGER